MKQDGPTILGKPVTKPVETDAMVKKLSKNLAWMAREVLE